MPAHTKMLLLHPFTASLLQDSTQDSLSLVRGLCAARRSTAP